MTCCKCTEYNWSPPVAAHYHAPDEKDYCIFHTPAEHKLNNTEELVRALEIRIREYLPRDTFCNLSGAILTTPFNLSELANTKNINARISLDNCIFHDDANFEERIFQKTITCCDTNFEKNLSLYKSTFNDDVNFLNSNCSGHASFAKSIFNSKTDFTNFGFFGDADFSTSTFNGVVDFIRTYFTGETNFSYSKFAIEGYFSHSKFEKPTKFDNSTFYGTAFFQGVSFDNSVTFDSSIFKGETNFGESTFTGKSIFTNTTFKDETSFKNITSSNDLTFDNTTFRNEVTFQSSNFDGAASFEWCSFLNTTNFIDTKFFSTCTFRNATFKSTSKFFNCFFKKTALFQDIHSVFDMRFSSLDLNHIDLIGTPLNNIWFQELICPRATNEERYKIPQEDDNKQMLKVADFYRQMKRHYKDRQNDTEASLWHFAEKESQLQHYKINKTSKFLETFLKLYRFSSRYGESPLRAAITLSLLLLLLFLCLTGGVLYKYNYSIVFSWSCIGKFFLTFFQYALLIKPDWEPPSIFAILALVVSRLLIPIQAALFGFALRNRFMR